jgi:hypothetical protein
VRVDVAWKRKLMRANQWEINIENGVFCLLLQYLIVLIKCNAKLQVMIVYGDNQLIIGILPPILDLV